MKRVLLLGMALLSLTMLIAGCEDTDHDTSPILPGQIAVLDVSFQPNPVAESATLDVFRYVATFLETNGVGVNMNYVRAETRRDDGTILSETDGDETWFRETFGTSYLPANGRLLANFRTETREGKRVNWVFKGVDDFGNSVETSEIIELIHN